MGKEVKRIGNVDKNYALSLDFYIIPLEKSVRVYGTAQERAFLFYSCNNAEAHGP